MTLHAAAPHNQRLADILLIVLYAENSVQQMTRPTSARGSAECQH